MNWKKYTLLAVSTLLVVTVEQIVHACAGSDDPTDQYPSFFLNNVNSDPAYAPFYYTGLLHYYDDSYYTKDTANALPDINTQEWRAYCNNSATIADIDSFVYKYPLADVKQVAAHISKGTPLRIPSAEVQNTFIQWLVKAKDAEAASYLVYAKECEPYALPQEGYYDKKTYEWKLISRDTTAMAPLMNKGIAAGKEAKKDFIRLRYAYQAMRMAFYSGRNSEALQLYNTLVGDNPVAGVIYPRCVAIKAGALFRTGKRAEAAYWYSRAFDASDEMKKTAHISFNWATYGNIDTALTYCKNDHEKAVLYLMNGLYENKGQEMAGLAIMGKAYSYDPNVKGLDMLMTRELNKAEERYQKTIGFGQDYYIPIGDQPPSTPDKAGYKSYLASLNTFAQKVAADGKVKEKAYWQLASAYIYYMMGDYTGCKQYLDLAAKGSKTHEQQDVYAIINILWTLSANGKITAATEEQVLPQLKWIERRAATEARFQKLYRDVLLSVMAPAYMKQSDTIKAIYLLPRTYTGEYDPYYDDFFADASGQLLEKMGIDNLHTVQAFVNKAGKTAFEQWLTNKSRYPLDVLKELEVTKYIRQYEFDKAVAIFKTMTTKVPAAERALPDFLVSHILDSQDWNRSDSANQYTKPQFAARMLELQQKLAQNPADGRTAYQYANGLYSMTYYGKAHHAFDYYRHSTDDFAYYATPQRAQLPPYMQQYYSAQEALKYYMIAYASTTDAEVKARCLYLAAKCWQKSAPLPEKMKNERYYFLSGDNSYYVNALHNPYFKQLKDYKNTKFYGSAVSTCSYLKDYVKKF